ncbi:MAG: hypothetical protein M5R37_14180 [Melioribacteraceae bacterium]|nr:hypothetical protein [Melioribacteraceae bacterium]
MIVILVQSCENDNTDRNKYYEGNFIDELFIVTQSDTTNIVIEQFQKLPFQNDSLIYSFEGKNDSSDLITLELFVSFGSYSQHPKVNKEVNSIMDTIYIWYDSYVWNPDASYQNNSLYKNYSNNLITEISLEPKLEYIVIDSILVHKSNYKVIRLNTRFKVYH